jgi:Ca-activated chloride channel family protein
MWLFGASLAVVVAALYIASGMKLVASLRAFGHPPLVATLVTERTGGKRALKGALVVLAVALGFLALAGPQYGRGTRLIPATNLDCVIVLDYSKSMYARDVAPTRTERAKAEVARLIADLPGARFGAVAFAGEPLSFPLTSDGGAIAQFFRQTTPNDMPVGGTAIARALEAARELLKRDPLSEKHQKVILLVTDGEDLEGNPVEVAEAANKDGVTVHVVQIGTRAPETIPEVDQTGQVVGLRKDAQGRPLTTSLSVDGEKQLSDIARLGSGKVVRAESGQTGIDEIAIALKRLMTEELAERVETVYADVFYYPLGIAVLLLVLEVFIPVARRRKLLAGVASIALMLGCRDKEQQVFSRYSPVVDEAITALGSVDAGVAEGLLSEYLSTGKCKDGTLGTPDQVRELPHATLDLGLTLFRLAERFGSKFGDPAPATEDPNLAGLLVKRSQEVDCALRLVRIIAADKDIPLELRAQAYYLSGNLEFLRYDYRAAVDSFDQAIRLSPGGSGDAGTDLGTRAAFNRAIALARAIEDEENEPPKPDGGTPPPSDGGGEPNQDQKDQDQKDQDQKDQDQKDQDQKDQDQKDQDQKDQDQKDQDQKDQDQKDQDQKDQDQKDQDQKDQDQKDQNSPGQQEPPPAPSENSAPAKPPSLSQDDRMLDQLERAPMFQHVTNGQQGRARVNMEDK